jgi:DNA replication and repair protein RecF
LLKEGASSLEFSPWTEGLIAAVAALRRDRFLYVQRLIPFFSEVYRKVTGGEESAELDYPYGGVNDELLRNTLRQDLKREWEKERRLGQTLAGPHRDDVEFRINGFSLRLYGSQGQQRSYILAFKAAQIMDLEATTGESPVLLLDDMTSELDQRRQSLFFRFLHERQGQVFITTTDIAPLEAAGMIQARYFRLDQGTVKHYTPETRTK